MWIKIISKIGWIVVIFFAIYPTIYFFVHLSDPEFIDSTMGNWFATMLGAFVGILIALEINKYQENIAERKEQLSRETEENQRKSKILRLIKNELESDLSKINDRSKSEQGKIKRTVSTAPLRNETWNAFSDGGELQWIKDIDLLEVISTAYYNIQTIMYLEDKYVDFIQFGIANGGGRGTDSYIANLLDYLIEADSNAIQSIEDALAAINMAVPQNDLPL